MKLLSGYSYLVDTPGVTARFDFKSEWRYDSTVSDGSTSEMIAEDAAENYYYTHAAGKDVTWPVRFTIYTDLGALVGRFTIDMERTVQFNATQEAT